MTALGVHMAREMAEAPAAFARAAAAEVAPLEIPKAIYTFARGSSDAVANVLSYEFMDRLGIPVTSLPPSVFSLGNGVALDGAIALIVSQSGASDDLVACARSAGTAVAITNVEGSQVEALAARTIRIGAGVEHAVPATKTVLGALGAGLALLAAFRPELRGDITQAREVFAAGLPPLANQADLATRLSAAQHIYVLGRRCSYGVAQELALKLKETCALHAEAHSASEVLHGPLQLSANPLTVLVLDACDAESQPSLDAAEARFRAEGADVHRIRACEEHLIGPAQAAALLAILYPLVHATANQLGLDPDAPATLMKVTRTT